MFGASSNIVAAGICVREGRALRYVEFARFGIPVMVVQLIVSAIYLKLRFLR
jgi:Na+/H+ antiporter NhaD/arsenite permease-like protein